MKRVSGYLFSPQLMGAILAIFALSIALATFIENDFGSISARTLVYNARWFEVLLLLGMVNLTGRIFTMKCYTAQKFPVFLFHISFVIIIAGAAISRYTGWEGTLSVREEQSTNKVLTSECFIHIKSFSKDSGEYRLRTSFSPVSRNRLKKSLHFGSKAVDLKTTGYIINAYETIGQDIHGRPVAEIFYSGPAGRKSEIIGEGETLNAGNLIFAFNTAIADYGTIKLTSRGDSLYFIAPGIVSSSNMDGTAFQNLEAHMPHMFYPRRLYTFQGQPFVLNQFLKQGKILVNSLPQHESSTYNAVILTLTSGNEKKQVTLMGRAGNPGIPEQVKLNGIDFLITYGSLYREIPFKLTLNDFTIDRYPGSHSPSSFESLVTLIDEKNQYTATSRIYMNNILKYKGFRFYQTSYDPDEKGTILSVNHDLAGTSVTYTGYILLVLGMILSLFIRKSRFREVSADSNNIRTSRRMTMVSIALLFIMQNMMWANDDHSKPPAMIPADHAAKFGRMPVQVQNGRVVPINTLSSEILRKLYRSSTYKGLNSDQVFLGMLTNPSAWQYEPMIRSGNSEIRKMLGTNDRYFSFASFFRNNEYALQKAVDDAFRKKPAERSKYENELMRLDERINICYLVFKGELLRLFPVPGDSTLTWYHAGALKGKIFTEDTVFIENVLYMYAEETSRSLQSGNWESPDLLLNAIMEYQRKHSGSIIPSSKEISMEILLNRTDIFSRISTYYGIAGFLLILFQFAGILWKRVKLRIPVILGTILIVILFCAHTLGLVLRWYISGHAPLSNGYEALIYVGWATVLAGLIFAYRSSFSLSVTAILACLILFVAHLGWMDPQITNLVPVLKSYWLIIHVATITASYGFLAMCALMAFLNLLLMIFQNQDNRETIRLTIRDLGNIIEMSMTIGIYLLTTGIFLGAVWANESWGRYWGWDPKETWALVTVLVYAFILHMRMIPGFRGHYAFNLASLLGFSSVMMTYFGVNYYLSGLHSYAKGDPLPVPVFVFYTLAMILLTAVLAYKKRDHFKEINGIR